VLSAAAFAVVDPLFRSDFAFSLFRVFAFSPVLAGLFRIAGGEEESCAGAEQGSVSTDTSEKSFPAIRFACPKCGTAVTVSQSQGDRCPGCGFEFKWFLPHEAQPARDYHAVLTGEKYLVELPDSAGWVVAHY